MRACACKCVCVCLSLSLTHTHSSRECEQSQKRRKARLRTDRERHTEQSTRCTRHLLQLLVSTDAATNGCCGPACHNRRKEQSFHHQHTQMTKSVNSMHSGLNQPGCSFANQQKQEREQRKQHSTFPSPTFSSSVPSSSSLVSLIDDSRQSTSYRSQKGKEPSRKGKRRFPKRKAAVPTIQKQHERKTPTNKEKERLSWRGRWRPRLTWIGLRRKGKVWGTKGSSSSISNSSRFSMHSSSSSRAHNSSHSNHRCLTRQCHRSNHRHSSHSRRSSSSRISSTSFSIRSLLPISPHSLRLLGQLGLMAQVVGVALAAMKRRSLSSKVCACCVCVCCACVLCVRVRVWCACVCVPFLT